MPIYHHTYRSYDGQFRRRFRWWTVVLQEFRVLLKSKIFLVLLLGALLHFIMRLLTVVAYDVVIQDPNNPLSPILRQIQAIVVNEQMFLDFIRIQAGLVFLTTIYAGAGMICNDFNNNLMEIYFSKPITWIDYALGKVLTLILIGLTLTAVPAVILVVMHNLLLPGMETLSESYWWPFAIFGFSLTIVLPCALGVLASSALLKSHNYASIAIFMILVADVVMSTLLAAFLRNPDYMVLSFPMAQNRFGEYLFGVRATFNLSWIWAFAFVVAVCLISLWIVFRRVRRAEVAA